MLNGRPTVDCMQSVTTNIFITNAIATRARRLLRLNRTTGLQSREYICRCHTTHTFFFLLPFVPCWTRHYTEIIPLIVVVRAFIPIYVFLSAVCVCHWVKITNCSFFSFLLPLYPSFVQPFSPSAFVEPIFSEPNNTLWKRRKNIQKEKEKKEIFCVARFVVGDESVFFFFSFSLCWLPETIESTAHKKKKKNVVVSYQKEKSKQN